MTARSREDALQVWETPPAIVRAEVFEVALSLREPFVTSFGPTTGRRTVVVRIEDADGRVGWGEGPALDHPFYLPYTTSTTFSIVEEYALPMALGAGPERPADIAEALAPIRGNGFARAAVEAAYWGLASLQAGIPLRDALGGSRRRIEVGESIGIKESIDATLQEVALRLDQGYRRIKLKIRPGWDLEVVKATREAFGDIVLQVDANAGYTLDDIETLAALDAFGLRCLEQPLEYDDLHGHAELQAKLETPVCLDESLWSVERVQTALRVGACRNVNLKPSRAGGLTAALAVHDMCAEAGVPLWCGGMLESGIGRATNIALCSLEGFTDPADMSPASILFEWDLVDPTYVVEPDGCIEVPAAAGLGYNVDEGRVKSRTVRHAVLRGAGA